MGVIFIQALYHFGLETAMSTATVLHGPFPKTGRHPDVSELTERRLNRSIRFFERLPFGSAAFAILFLIVSSSSRLRVSATKLLGLRPEEVHIFDDGESWPEVFTAGYDDVSLTCYKNRVEHYIKTGSIW